jgi:hypothetical protein
MGTICQYENIHLSTLSGEVDALFNKKVQQTKLLTDKSKCTGRSLSVKRQQFDSGFDTEPIH